MSDIKKDNTIFNKPINRRQFLKASAVAAAGLSLGSAGCSSDESDNYDEKYPDVPENKVKLKSNGKSVLVLGGGFSGMHAACELVDRGFKVTVIETSSMLGGKLKSWRDKSFGVPPADDPNWKGYPRDHGCHAVWGFYNNLREFMRRHNYKLFRFPDISSIYNFVDRDGTNEEMKYKTNMSFPLRTLDSASKVLNSLGKISGEDLGVLNLAMIKAISFDFDDVEQRMYLDSISFPEWARSIGIPHSLIYKFFAPLSEMAMFDHIDNSSALYTMMLLTLCAGYYKDVDIDVFMHPPGETYVAPIEKYIRDGGGEIIFNTPVIKLNVEGKRIKSVSAGMIDDKDSSSQARKWKCKVCGSVFSSPTKPAKCPVCGAPASEIVAYSAGKAKEYIADYYVVAMDTPGAQKLITSSNFPGDKYFNNIMKLGKVSVFPVNLWYNNKSIWKKRFPQHMDFFASSFKYLGITLDWASDGTYNGKKITEPIVPEYAKQDISVIETQIADAERIASYDDDTIAKLVHEELKLVMPDLPEPTDFYVNRWDTYSPQRVGYEALRPDIQSPMDNLFFIGDWVKTNHLSVYMEKSYVAAKMVTNLILDKIGQDEGRMKVLRSGSTNAILELVQTIFSIYP